jgi:D-alanyl-D-alanine dipeptidase
MTEIVPMSDPRVAAIPVTECGERLVDVRHVGWAYFEEYAESLRALHPEWPEERIHRAASQCGSPPES